MKLSSQNVSLSKSDIGILKLLQKDSAINRRELADKTGLSLSTLSRRINELEALGVIQKKVVIVDPDRVGISVSIFVSVNLSGYEKRQRQDFEEFVEQSPSIMECFRVTGGFDYILIVKTTSVASFERFLLDEILAHKSVATAASTIALHQTKYTTALDL